MLLVSIALTTISIHTLTPAYVKAAARDTKAYLRGIGSQTLVGYAAVDGEANFRTTLAEYLTCGNESIVVDLYGGCGLSLALPAQAAPLSSLFWTPTVPPP
jgi:hypothetical protein